MLWLPITIISYFFFAIGNLVDRYFLAGPMQKPHLYAFYVGIVNIITLALIPFGFYIPPLLQIFYSFIAGALWILAIWMLYVAIFEGEVSRIVPAVGGLLPIFTLFFSFILFVPMAILTVSQIIAFLFLVSGSVIISIRGNHQKNISFWKNLKLAAIAAFSFALGFAAMKFVFTQQPFINGLIWMKIGSFLTALLFLFSKEVRKSLFSEKPYLQKKLPLIFAVGQVVGATATMLQTYAVFLVGAFQVSFINALEGVKYIFIMIFAAILAKRSPEILKEEIFGLVLFQKLFAIILIIAGLWILTWTK